MHTPAALAQRLRHGHSRKDVAASATRHDQGAFLHLTHTRPPCMSWRFS